MGGAAFTLRPIVPADRAWLPELARQRWGDEMVVGHGVVYRLADLPGFVAEAAGAVVGLATYVIGGADCELVSIDSMRPGQGIGTALLDAVAAVARAACCRRIWLITTNDNLHALGFYQRRGYALVALHRDAVSASRLIKPAIPLYAENGIPIRDELELELHLE